MPLVQTLVGVGTAVIGLVLGLRLLRLAARTRGAPELAMGLYCLLVTLCGLLLWVAFRILPSESPWVAPVSAASTFAVGAAAFALAVGVGRIFHPGKRGVRAVIALLGPGLLACWIATVAPGEPVRLADASLANGLFVAGRVAVYVFGALEAFRYASMLRRRVALGLADPVSTNQIFLWGVAWLSMALIAGGSLALTAGLGVSAYERAWTGLGVSLLNLTAWGCTWFAFFPPASYQRLLERRHAEAPA